MEEYGHVREGETPEVTGLRLVTSVETPSPRVTRGFNAAVIAAQAAKSRRANLGQGYQATPVFLGTALKPGHEVTGPAIIDETFTTIVVYPGWKARVDDAGDYELARIGTSAAAPTHA
jgi:N-methylhydantoinase A